MAGVTGSTMRAQGPLNVVSLPANDSWKSDVLFDDGVLGHLSELAPDHRDSLLERAFRTFELSVNEQLALMHEGRARGDSNAVRIAAQTLGASCGPVGAIALATLGARIERLAGSGGAWDQAIDQVSDCYAQTIDAIVEWRLGVGPS